MTRFHLSYAGYADHCTGQLGDPATARPIPLMEGVLGFFLQGNPRLLSGFHIEHFHAFNSWEDLRELLGAEVADKVYEFHQEVGSLGLPSLGGLSEEDLRTAMKQSVVRKEFEVDWIDDSEVAERLRGVVDRWESGE